MQKKSPLDRTLCLKFCSFYKPGKNEELACKGYTVVERLILSGRVPGGFKRSGRLLDRRETELLIQTMCLSCDFHEHDCDYMQDRSASPCGGFALLTQLIADGLIATEDAK